MPLPSSKFSIKGLVVIDDGEDGIPATKATIPCYKESRNICLNSSHILLERRDMLCPRKLMCLSVQWVKARAQ